MARPSSASARSCCWIAGQPPGKSVAMCSIASATHSQAEGSSVPIQSNSFQ
jgi:hypothetical protein